MIGIYKITNLLNGKVYIGQSINIKKRWYYHKSNLRNSNKFWYPIAREESNSINDFLFEVIEECSLEELDKKEKYWISFYNSTADGYNSTFGRQHKTQVGKIEETNKEIKENSVEGQMTLQEKIQTLMTLGVSISKLAEPIHRTTIYKWLSGERNLSFEKQQYLEKSIQTFLEKVEELK